MAGSQVRQVKNIEKFIRGVSSGSLGHMAAEYRWLVRKVWFYYSQAYIVAYMTQAAEIDSEDRVLEIGTGCGYQTAILGEIARQVYSIEIQPQLATTARETLDWLGYQNIEIETGNGYRGWAEHAPYNAIIVTAAPEKVPPALIEQLAVGGTMVIPVGTRHQNMIVLTKSEEKAISKKTIPVRFVPMREKLS